MNCVCVRFCGDGTPSIQIRTTCPKGRSQTGRMTYHQRSKRHMRENKRRAFFLLFILGELPWLISQPAELRPACIGLSPPPRLQKHTPHPPDWACHTMARQNPPQSAPNRLGLHTGTLTLTPDFPRLTITLGGWGLLLEITLATTTRRTTTPPTPFCVFIRRSILPQNRPLQREQQQRFFNLTTTNRHPLTQIAFLPSTLQLLLLGFQFSGLHFWYRYRLHISILSTRASSHSRLVYEL